MKKNKVKKIQNFSSFCTLLPIVKKKLINVFGNVNLHPLDCPYENFVNFPNNKAKIILLQNLNGQLPNLQQEAREVVLNTMRNIAESSNSNLVRNANALMAKNDTKIDTEVKFIWVRSIHQQNQTKFKLGY